MWLRLVSYPSVLGRTPPPHLTLVGCDLTRLGTRQIFTGLVEGDYYRSGVEVLRPSWVFSAYFAPMQKAPRGDLFPSKAATSGYPDLIYRPPSNFARNPGFDSVFGGVLVLVLTSIISKSPLAHCCHEFRSPNI